MSDGHGHSHAGHSHSHAGGGDDDHHHPTHSHSHSHHDDDDDNHHSHSHSHSSSSSSSSYGGHGHSHEGMDRPGDYHGRALFDRSIRNFSDRCFTVGIGGPVGSGKTALIRSLCEYLRDKYNIVVVTNDIFTKEDGEFLIKNKALSADRIRAVETGGCPHAAIREDCTENLLALEELTKLFHPDFAFCESGGDNLAANFSRELADYIIYVIDVAGGDKVPRKGGPGITQSDLLIINKTDLSTAVGADMKLMEEQALKMRSGGPTILSQVKFMKGIEEISKHIIDAWKAATTTTTNDNNNDNQSIPATKKAKTH